MAQVNNAATNNSKRFEKHTIAKLEAMISNPCPHINDWVGLHLHVYTKGYDINSALIGTAVIHRAASQKLWVQILPSGTVAVAVNSPSLFISKLCHALGLQEDRKDAWTRVRVVDPITGVGAWIDQYRYHYNQSLRIADPTTFVAKEADSRSQAIPPEVGGPHAVQTTLGTNAVPLDNGPTGRTRVVGSQSATTATRPVQPTQAVATTQPVPAMGLTWMQPAMGQIATHPPAAMQPAMTQFTRTWPPTTVNGPVARVAPMTANAATAYTGNPATTIVRSGDPSLHFAAGPDSHYHASGRTMPTMMTSAPPMATSTGSNSLMRPHASDLPYHYPPTVTTHPGLFGPTPYNRMDLGNSRLPTEQVYHWEENVADGDHSELSAMQEHEENVDIDLATDH